MRRLVSSLAMAVVGISVLSLHLAAAALFLWVVWNFVFETVDVVTVLSALVVTTAVFGYLSYRFGTTQALSGLEATELPRDLAPGTYRRLDQLSAAMGVSRPRIYLAEMDAPNAFTLGGARRGTIVIDRSLFDLLEADEFEAILAHELAHLASYDSLLKTLAYSAVQTVAGLVSFAVLPLVIVAVGSTRAVAWVSGRPLESEWRLGRLQRGLVRVVGAVFFVLTVALFAHSRRREYVADARAVRTTGNPTALARALRKIELAGSRRWFLSPLYVRGEETGQPLTRLLSTHPSTDDRIERLLGGADRPRRPSR